MIDLINHQPRQLTASAAVLLLIGMTTVALQASEIKSDEVVLFFPVAAHLDADQKHWIIPVHGWIYEPEFNSRRRNILIDQIASGLKLVPKAGRDKAFRSRMRMFLADNECGKTLQIRIGDKKYDLEESGANGHFQANLKIPRDQIANPPKPNGWLSLQAVTDEDDERKFIGQAQLVGPSGVCVVSDIDDTIKDSNVLNKTQLIINTFVLSYKPAAGMAEVYARWSKQGASFHYVSSSPWQLYPALSVFMTQNGFPDGSFHLKSVRFKDQTLANLIASSAKTKPPIIESIMKRYPGRRFIMVGDSGEKDPEVYGLMARNHPKQIIQIYIRRVQGADNSDTRFNAAFKDVPKEKWTVFTDAAKLADLPAK